MIYSIVTAGVLDRWFLVFQSFGQHGRELITSELALQILSILTEEESLDSSDSVTLNSVLDKLVIKVTWTYLSEQATGFTMSSMDQLIFGTA